MSKAGRPKNGSAKLPNWFDIQKYQKAKDFGAMQWYEQLAYREKLFSAYDECLNNKQGFDILQPAFKRLQIKPIVTTMEVYFSDMELVDDDGNHVCFCCRKKGQRMHMVHRQDPVIKDGILPGNGAGIKRLPAYMLKHIEPKDYQRPEKMPRPTFHDDGMMSWDEPCLTCEGRPVVTIDLSLKDEILIREMRELLHTLRKTEKAEPLAFVKNSDFLKWYNSGVLPYMDLLLWQNIGNDFVWAAFIDELNQILAKPISSESALMKSAQTYAKKLLDKQTIRVLEAQAASERNCGLKKSGKLHVT